MLLNFLPAHQAKKFGKIKKTHYYNINMIIDNPRRIWKLLRYVWIFLYLSYCKTKDVFISQYNGTTRELFILKIIFIYFIYLGFSYYLEPRIIDFIYLDIPYYQQIQFMLLNMGIFKNSVSNLNHLSNDNAIFALDLVNSDYSLNNIITNLEIMACSFKSSKVIILVSPHSNDHTRDIITNWKKNIKDCNLIHQKTQSIIYNPSLLINNNLDKTDMMLINTNYTKNKRIFWKDGSIDIIAITPRKELEAVQNMIETKRVHPEFDVDIGEYRAIFHRNLLLDKALELYNDNNNNNNDNNKNGKDYLIFIGANTMINFDVQSVATQFKIAWNYGYDVVCANGIKYNGWYYDSFPTILEDNTWFIGIGRIKNTKTIRNKQFINVNSCNNGFISYDLKLIKDTGCKYLETKKAFKQVPSIKNFTSKQKIKPKRISLHVPFNFCLKERGDAKISIASKAYTYLGVEKTILTQLDERM